jgi:hypothetical protein
MKHLVPFRIYESQTTSGLTKKQEDFLNRNTKGTWSVNPTTGLVDIHGSFNLENKGAKSFLGVKFGNVNGDFCISAIKLQSLEGAPRKVDGDFKCSSNNLQSLEGAPLEVNGNFWCPYNQLQSLEGAPQEVGGDFYCFHNQLQSLERAPQKVGRDFDCSFNELQSLSGSPQKVDGDFDCSHNQLQSLEGAPKQIDGTFECDEFLLNAVKWNMKGWLEVLRTRTGEAKKLILTLPYIQPDWWNSELQRDPGKTVHLLAPWWKDMPENMKSKIKIPSGYENEFNLFSEFDELGLF